MAEEKKSPFAGLDKALLRSTQQRQTPPENQQPSLPVSQRTSEPVNQLASKPVSQLTKATFYLSPEHIMRLEHLRLERIQKGEKVDKSALVREAIELLTSKPA